MSAPENGIGVGFIGLRIVVKIEVDEMRSLKKEMQITGKQIVSTMVTAVKVEEGVKAVNAPDRRRGVEAVSGLAGGMIETNLVVTGIMSELKREVVGYVHLRERVTRTVLGREGEP